jgi:hypothetical protein
VRRKKGKTMKWILRFVVGFSYMALIMTLALLIRPENASKFWASVHDLWPLVVFVTLTSSVIIGDTFIGMVEEWRDRRKETA